MIDNLRENSHVLSGVSVWIILGVLILEAGLMRLGLVLLGSVSILTVFDVVVVICVLTTFGVIVSVSVLIVTGLVLVISMSVFIASDFVGILYVRRVLSIGLTFRFGLCLVFVLWSLFQFMFLC
jgi:hypothetical protein